MNVLKYKYLDVDSQRQRKTMKKLISTFALAVTLVSAHGPTVPPPPDCSPDGSGCVQALSVKHGPTVPPDPWDGLRTRNGNPFPMCDPCPWAR